MPATPKLIEETSIVARLKHLSLRTEKAYLQHIKRFILFHHKRHSKAMGEAEIRAYMSDLAINIIQQWKEIPFSSGCWMPVVVHFRGKCPINF